MPISKLSKEVKENRKSVNKQISKRERQKHKAEQEEESLLHELNMLIDANTELLKDTRQDVCRVCEDGGNVIYDNKTYLTICNRCGYVVGVLQDDRPEWCNRDDDVGDFSRCVAPINYLLPQSSLGTTISGPGALILKRLHSWTAMPYKERSFNRVLKQIEEICVKGGIEKRIEMDAKILCKNVLQGTYIDNATSKQKTIIIRGLNRNSMIAGSIFFACRRKGKSRTQKEIADIAKLDYTDVTSGCSAFNKLAKRKGYNFESGLTTPEHFIRRYCLKLNMSEQFMKKALNVAEKVKILNIASRHTPKTVAASVIMLLADTENIEIDIDAIKEMFDISSATVDKTLKIFKDVKPILISDKYFNMVLVEKLMLDDNNKNSIETSIEIIDHISSSLNNMIKEVDELIKQADIYKNY